jgi:drug/metabolite transporter (DMT)-like permease
MPVLLGALSAALIAVSDTLGRSGSRRVSPVSHVSTAMAAGVGTAVVLALVLSNDLIAADVGRGALSGLLASTALALLYKGMADSSAAIASPVAAVFVGLIPLVWDLAGGADLSGLAAVGCGIGIGSLALTTFNPNLGNRVLGGLAYGLVGGVLFGAVLILLGATSEASGAWPVAAQRFVGFITMVFFAMRTAAPVFLPRRLLVLGILSGVAGTSGIVAFAVGAQTGDLGVVSVAASMFPAGVAVLSRLFDEDELHWWQAIGIAGAIAGTALIALGSDG